MELELLVIYQLPQLSVGLLATQVQKVHNVPVRDSSALLSRELHDEFRVSHLIDIGLTNKIGIFA